MESVVDNVPKQQENPIFEVIKPKNIMVSCSDKCFFEEKEREAICKKCGRGVRFVRGYHIIEDGIVKVKERKSEVEKA